MAARQLRKGTNAYILGALLFDFPRDYTENGKQHRVAEQEERLRSFERGPAPL